MSRPLISVGDALSLKVLNVGERVADRARAETVWMETTGFLPSFDRDEMDSPAGGEVSSIEKP